MRTPIALLISTTATIAVLALVLTVRQLTGLANPLPPCATDEYEQGVTPDCIWQADTMGDGQGASFTIQGGQLHYLHP